MVVKAPNVTILRNSVRDPCSAKHMMTHQSVDRTLAKVFDVFDRLGGWDDGLRLVETLKLAVLDRCNVSSYK